MNNKIKKPKAVIIGIDGATFDLILPWAKSNFLPNLKHLLENGTYGKLESTIPPITGPAWASFQTGKNPGQHGIFDWLTRDEKSYGLVPINANFLKEETLWEIISKQGKKVGIMNVPLTYPVKKVNGFLVSGMPTPSKKSEFAYPPDLKLEIEKNFKDYQILPVQQFDPLKIKKWIAGLKQMIRARKELAVYLIKKYNWDFFMVHFVATDIIQHRMWHKAKNELADNPVLEIYIEIDKAIGEIMNNLPSNTSLFLISDHGFGPLFGNLYLNNWLLKERYLFLKNDFFTLIKRFLYKIGITPATGYKLLGKIGFLGKGLALGKGERYNLLSKFFLSAQNINWKKTKAYSYGNIGQIYINTFGREPSGWVEKEEKGKLTDEIISKLKKMINPKTGRQFFDKIYRKEEIYSGHKLKDAPDIIVLPEKLETMAVGVSEFISNKIIEPSFAFTGGHRMNGIFIASGQNLKKEQKIEGARIIDLAPTLLYSLGLSMPDDMDGKVLKDIFFDEFLEQNKIRYIKKEKEAGKKERAFSLEEEEQIKRRLKDLGYV